MRQRRSASPAHAAVHQVACTLPVAFVVHDLEEVIAADWWTRNGSAILTHALPWLPSGVVRTATLTTTPQMAVATSIVGLGVAGVTATAVVGRRERPLRAATLVFTAHGLAHLASAIAVRSYTPGAATAALVVLPWGGWALQALRTSDPRDVPTRRRDTALVAASTIAAALAGHAIARRAP